MFGEPTQLSTEHFILWATTIHILLVSVWHHQYLYLDQNLIEGIHLLLKGEYKPLHTQHTHESPELNNMVFYAHNTHIVLK